MGQRIISFKTCVLLFVAFGLLAFYKSGSFYASNYKSNSLNVKVEEVLQFYWLASLNGEKDKVGLVSAYPSRDMFQNCVGTNTNIINEDLPLQIDKIEPENSKSFVEKYSDSPFENVNIPGDITATSEYIYFTQIPFSRLNIIEKKELGSEAILKLSILDMSNNPLLESNTLVFFSKQDQSWKIVGIASEKVLNTISKEIYYATPRTICE